MSIGAWHIMREKVSVAPDTTAREVSHKIIASGLPGLPVVNDAMEVVGMVTEYHILGALREDLDLDAIPAEQLMIKAPLTADVTTPPNDLIKMLLVNNCCAVIPIVHNNKYVGLISRHTLMDIYTSPHYSRFVQKDPKGPFACL